MTSTSIKDFQDSIEDFLVGLSQTVYDESSPELTRLVSKLLSLYSADSRHLYSRFYQLIRDLNKNSECSLDYLASNLSLIFSELVDKSQDYNPQNDPLLSKAISSVIKLYDHINIEIARYNESCKYTEMEHTFTESLNNALSEQSRLNNLIQEREQELQHLKSQFDSAASSLNDATLQSCEMHSLMEKTQKQIDTSQASVISILSIFSAIVIAFFGGFSFMGNAIASINAAPLYKTLTVCFVCGLVLFDSVFLLLYLVAKLIGRNIYARCETENCTCKDGTPKCNPIERLRKRLPFVYYFNILILIALFINTVATLLIMHCH